MDENDALIFRYDNAAHFPELRSFPDHKHLPHDVVESEEPNLTDVLLEIYNLSFKNS